MSAQFREIGSLILSEHVRTGQMNSAHDVWDRGGDVAVALRVVVQLKHWHRGGSRPVPETRPPSPTA